MLRKWDEKSGRDFHSHQRKHQEDVLARAKIRYIVVLSRNYAIRTGLRDVVVIPTYTLKEHKESFSERVRQNAQPDLHYLPADRNFPELALV
jgi:hypothetical protein